jgi:hypothetical protein
VQWDGVFIKAILLRFFLVILLVLLIRVIRIITRLITQVIVAHQIAIAQFLVFQAESCGFPGIKIIATFSGFLLSLRISTLSLTFFCVNSISTGQKYIQKSQKM